MSHIIKPGDRAFFIGRRRGIEVESRARIAVDGRYTIRAIRPDGKVRAEMSFPNLLTNLGLNAIGQEAKFNRMHLGTGTSIPDVTDTSLANFGVNVQSGSPSQNEYGVEAGPPRYGWTRLTWTSTAGGATGTWTEIGISDQNTNGNLRSRALILDGGGNPTSFPVLSDEQFQGTYEMRTYLPASDAQEAVAMSGTPYDTTTRAVRGNASSLSTSAGWNPYLTSSSSIFRPVSSSGTSQDVWNGGLGAITDANPLGTRVAGNASISTEAYGSGNYYLDFGMRFGSGSSGSFRTFMFLSASGCFQTEYDPPITKLTTEEVIHNLRISWARR